MKWIAIKDSQEEHGDDPTLSTVKTYAYVIDKIGSMIMVITPTGSSVSFAPGTEVVDHQLCAMEGYGDMEDDEDVDEYYEE